MTQLSAFALLCFLGLCGVVVYSWEQVTKFDHQLSAERGERNLWATTQAERELQRFLLAAASIKDGNLTAADVALQRDLLISRLQLLLDGPQLRHFFDLGLSGEVERLKFIFDEFDELSSKENTPVSEIAHPSIMMPLSEVVHDLAVKTMLLERRQRVQLLQDRAVAQRNLLTAVIGASTIGASLSLLWLRNLRRLKAAHAELIRLNLSLEQKIAERTSRLREALEVERRARDIYHSFIMTVSHQLRAPVSVIHMISQRQKRTARVEVFDPGNIQRKFERIYVAAGKLEALLAKALVAAELDAEDMIANRTTVNFNDVVGEAVALFSQSEGADLLHVEYSLVALPVEVDPKLVEEVIGNLLSNAVKYSDKGLPIKIRTMVAENGVELRITDQGVGIPVEVGDMIFERFYRADNAKLHEGMGLGLYISRQIVEMHGGKIGYVSRLDKGTQFWMTLPSNGARSKDDLR